MPCPLSALGMSSSQSICLPLLSCQNHHPNRFNAKDMWHKSGVCPRWTGAMLLNGSSDLSLFIFSFLFHFLSLLWSSISSLLSPLYTASFHSPHFVTQMTFSCFQDSASLFLSTFSPPPLSLYLQWLMSFLFFLSLSFRSAQVPHLSQDGTHIMAHKMFNPPVL